METTFQGNSRDDPVVQPHHTHYQPHPLDPIQVQKEIPYARLPHIVYRTELGDSYKGQEVRKIDETGIGGYQQGRENQRRKHNSHFGPGSVWVSKTIDQAHNFIREVGPNSYDDYSIFAIKTGDHGGQRMRGIDMSDRNTLHFNSTQEEFRGNRDTPFDVKEKFHNLNMAKQRSYSTVALSNGEIVLDATTRIPADSITRIQSGRVEELQNKDRNKTEDVRRKIKEFGNAKINLDTLNTQIGSGMF